jgi:hypothetical protein
MFSLAAACTDGMDRLTSVEAEIGPGTCSPYFCGNGNSDIVDNMGLHDLNVKGLVNDTGFWIEDFRKDGVSYKARVQGSELHALDASGDVAWTGTKLIGAELVIGNTQNGLQYNILIAGVVESEYWAKHDGKIQYATTYELKWKTSTNDKYENVCVNPPPAGHPDLRGGQPPFSAVLFEGDRIDEITKRVDEKIDDDWFNIGCMGHALAKLHLTGHTEAAHRQRKFETKREQRETFLRMIVGDYCGTGTPFTIAGQPLDYRNSSKTVEYLSHNPLTIEARWAETGATCLNTPRLHANPSDAAKAAFPEGVLAAMAKTQGCVVPPPCVGGNIDDLAGHYLISANPQLP